MTEPAAVSLPQERHDALLEFVAEVQDSDWNHLVEAIGRAVNGYWSMEVEWDILRIRKAARLVGPTDVGDVPWVAFTSGLYDAVLQGLTYASPVEKDVARYREIMSGRMSEVQYASCVRTADRLVDKGVPTDD